MHYYDYRYIPIIFGLELKRRNATLIWALELNLDGLDGLKSRKFINFAV